MINDNWEQDCIKENEELWTCLNIDKDNDTHQTSIQVNEQNTDHETEEGEVNDTDSEVDETELSELLNTKANLAGLPLDLSPA